MENKSTLGYMLGILVLLTMIWTFIISKNYGGISGMDLLLVFNQQGTNVYLGFFSWALILGFIVIPSASWVEGSRSLLRIVGDSFDNAFTRFSKLGGDESKSKTLEEKNTLVLGALIYTFLLVGVGTVLYFFMVSFGQGFISYFADQANNSTINAGNEGLIGGVSFFFEAFKNLLWAYAGLITLSFLMNYIDKNIVQKEISDNHISGIEFLKAIVTVLFVVGMSYYMVNLLALNTAQKDVGSVIGIGVQGGTTTSNTTTNTTSTTNSTTPSTSTPSTSGTSGNSTTPASTNPNDATINNLLK